MSDRGTCSSKRSPATPGAIAVGAVAVLSLVVAVALAVSRDGERRGADASALIDLAAPPPGSPARLVHEETQPLPDERTMVERRYVVSDPGDVALWFEDSEARLRQAGYGVSAEPPDCTGREPVPCELRGLNESSEVVLRTVDGETRPRTVVVAIVGRSRTLHTPPMDPIGILEE